MADKTNKNQNEYERNVRRGDAALKNKLYLRASEMLHHAAEYSAKQESTWSRVYTETALNLIRAAEGL